MLLLPAPSLTLLPGTLPAACSASVTLASSLSLQHTTLTLPQGLCTAPSLCLEHFPRFSPTPDTCTAPSLTSSEVLCHRGPP